jgi:3-oxoacyl-[acyl-carrier protein] reductase
MAVRLKGKVAVVTGAVRGIGKAGATILALEGAEVLIVDIDQESGAKAVIEIEEAGGQASFLQADLSKTEDTKLMAKATVERHGRIDILFSNAGICPSVRIEEMPEADWDRVMAVNLKGTFLGVQSCLPQMIQQNYGRIVLTSSITGPITGVPGWSHYGATNAGMLGFMRSAALEFAKYNITINAVLPGTIKNGGLGEMGEGYIHRMEQTIPMGKIGEPEDVAHEMLLLASDEAKFITGQTLVVDGGQTLTDLPFTLS